MSEAKPGKQEWVFDGTKGDFWLFILLSCFALLSLIGDLWNLFWRYHRPTLSTSWTDWMAVIVLPLLAISFYQMERFLGIAAALSSLSIALKLAIAHQAFAPDHLITIRSLVELLTTGLLLFGCAMYLKHRLHRESVL